MTALRSTILLAAIASTCPALGYAQDAEEDPTEGRGPQLLAEAQAHENEGRFALAAERYLDLYGVMSEVNHPRAPVALWSAANALNELPGREEEAIDLLRRFLDESTALTDDERIRDWRSMAVTMIDELEARRGPRAMETEAEAVPPELNVDIDAQHDEGSISPVGPIVLGIGAASVLAGIITGSVALEEGDSLRAECGGSTCPSSEQDRIAQVTALSNTTDGLLFGGAAVAAAGLVLTLVLREGGDEEAPTAAMLCTERGCSISFGGSF